MPTPTPPDETSRYLSLLLDDALLADIDDFRFDHRFESRTAAMRWLLRTGLDKKLAPPKPTKKAGK